MGILYGIKTQTIYVNGEENRLVLEDFVDFDGTIIPKGFIFNGASSPRIAWRIIPPFKDEARSGRHDMKCAEAKVIMDRSKAFAKKGLIKRAGELKTEAKKIRLDEDRIFRDRTSNPIEKYLGYAGIRVGSFLGLGW